MKPELYTQDQLDQLSDQDAIKGNVTVLSRMINSVIGDKPVGLAVVGKCGTGKSVTACSLKPEMVGGADIVHFPWRWNSDAIKYEKPTIVVLHEADCHQDYELPISVFDTHIYTHDDYFARQCSLMAERTAAHIEKLKGNLGPRSAVIALFQVENDVPANMRIASPYALFKRTGTGMAELTIVSRYGRQ
ncbi:hypothetical protein [Nitrospirillum amazonense]|uniref:hypothetical protein n=1 Tax=Nitrospirillum amazonense TaxID=28077 RepID=UPI002412B10F|nr:hypothetical protein [Nitrospirillum amazonense]MDG3444570.1 hypothetical protein [Nitrospirillum amazonense]